MLVQHDVGEVDARALDFGPDIALVDVTSRDALVVGGIIVALCGGVTTIAMAVPEVAEDVIACADAGFAAYIPRSASAEMMAILDLAVRGETMCDPRITRSLFDELSAADRRPHRRIPMTASPRGRSKPPGCSPAACRTRRSPGN